MLRLTLFGGMAITNEHGNVKLVGAKLEALLALLVAASGKPVPREWLMSVLWGGRFEAQSRQSLRQALSRLRKSLGKDVLIADERFIRLRTDLISSDYSTFYALCLEESIDSLKQAAMMASQEFLAGLNLREQGFSDWVAMERRKICERKRKVLLQIVRGDDGVGADERALSTLESLLDEDPLDEEVHRIKLALLNRLGRRADALRAHQRFSRNFRKELDTTPSSETDQVALGLKAVSAPHAMRDDPDSPRLLVLPFANLSGDDLSYFAEGVVDELIVALSRLHWVTILSRSSTFSDRARAIDARQAGEEFGVRYALEGSIRRAQQRIRISGQLIDTRSGAIVWTERFDGTLEDVFELQDRFAARVIGTLQERLEHAEIERSHLKPTSSLDAYEHYLRGLSEVHRWTREGNGKALEHFYKAIALDRRFAAAYGMAARCFSQRKTSGWVVDEMQERSEADRLARCAVEFGHDSPIALSSAGIAVAFVGCRVHEGAVLIEQALTLNPGLASGWLYLGWVKAWSGEADAAIACVDRAIHLSPHDPMMAGMRRAHAFAHFIGCRYHQSLAEAKAVAASPQNASIAKATTAACAAIIGDIALARDAMSHLLRLEPKLRVATLRNRFPIVRDVDFTRFREALAQVGLPD